MLSIVRSHNFYSLPAYNYIPDTQISAISIVIYLILGTISHDL